MKILKSLALIGFIGSIAHAHAATETSTYGIQLHFSEQEAGDVMTIQKTDAGVSGTMHVPNDFDGKLDNLTVTDKNVEFDLFVPKNSGRPDDLIFHYSGQFFNASHEQLIGFVTIKDSPDFVASFTGFIRK